MSDEIISAIHKLVVAHQEVVALSKQKTETIKNGHIDELQTLLVKERKLARKLQQYEEERAQAVEKWSMKKALLNTSPTISEIINHIEDDKQEELLTVVTELTDIITELKKQEKLNQVLLNESMKFVQLSLDLMSPTLNNMNYGTSADTKGTSRSVFDSKA